MELYMTLKCWEWCCET